MLDYWFINSNHKSLAFQVFARRKCDGAKSFQKVDWSIVQIQVNSGQISHEMNLETWIRDYCNLVITRTFYVTFYGKKRQKISIFLGRAKICWLFSCFILKLHFRSPFKVWLLQQLGSKYHRELGAIIMRVYLHVSDLLSLLNQNLSWHSLHYAEACNEFAGPIFESLRPGKHSSFWRNVAAVVSRWQHCVRFDRSEIWTSDLPLQRETRYRSTNWPV